MITKEVFEEQKALSDRWKEMYYEKKNENEKLTNNWNELEEWLKSYIALIANLDTLEEQTLEDLKEVLDKMKEIKEKNDSIQ